VSVMPRGCIFLPVTFRTVEDFRTESVLFDVAEASLLFNASGQTSFVSVYGGGSLRIPGSKDAIPQ
jgi:hypothetical protein